MLALIPILPCAILAFLLKPHMDKWREPLYLVCILISCCVVIVAFDANGAGILMRYFADFGLLCSLAACLSMMALLNEYDSRNTQQIETTAASGAQVLLSKSLILTGLISLVLQLIELGIFST